LIESAKSMNELLQFLNKEFDQVACFENNNHLDKYGQFERFIAFGAAQILKLNAGDAFERFEKLISKSQLPICFILAYDLKNEVESLESKNKNHCECPDLIAFEPLHLLQVKENQLEYFHHSSAEAIEWSANFNINILPYHKHQPAVNKDFQHTVSKNEYVNHFNAIKNHIQKGDIYEINYCIPFEATYINLNPVETFCNLQANAPAPFGAFLKFDEFFLMSSSPERFLKKSGNHLISQPIKGTAKRHDDEKTDKMVKELLRQDIKEQNENVMIVDLVRNDLSKIATKNSVKVEELFGIYSFAKVHQMISTVTAICKEETDSTNILKACFPMASMTGTPKYKAMQLIEKYENFKRCFYSGAIGHITSTGDLDSSVIIRSVIFNEKIKKAFVAAGSAITAMAEAEMEYEECLLKVDGVLNSIVCYD